MNILFSIMSIKLIIFPISLSVCSIKFYLSNLLELRFHNALLDRCQGIYFSCEEKLSSNFQLNVSKILNLPIVCIL